MKSKIFTTIFLLSGGTFLSSVLAGWMNKPAMIERSVIERSVTKSLMLLQKSGYTFVSRSSSKCASCHHNTLTAMAVEIADQKGIPVVDSFERSSVKAMERTIRALGNPNLINEFLPVNFVAPYILLGLAAEKSPPDLYTDLSVDYLMGEAKMDGSFLTESGRVPLETGNIHLTALAIRAIRLYASPAKQDRVNELLARTRQWLEQAKPVQHQELVFQLLGMYWCGSDRDKMATVAKMLRSMQNADGGWSQLPTLGSDAYATGQTLYALHESGMDQPEDEVYQKGMSFLLKTQDESGAWIVETRSYPIQPFFSSDFPPYDENQYISATASNWSVMALMEALPDKTQ
jgi:hypothetical protein